MNGRQVAMARAALGWTIAELSGKSGISESTIKRCERGGGLNTSSADALRKAFEKARLVILDSGTPSLDGGAGIRFRDRD